MTEQTPEQTPESTPEGEQTPPEGEQTPPETPATGEGEQKPEGEAALGDAGKRALDAMKAERKAAREAAAAEKARADALQAKLDGKEAEHQAAQDAQKIRDEALAAANERILKANVRAEAASKLADPQDALLHINLSEFEVGSDGEVDSSAIAQAIDDLIEKKPYLAAQGRRFQGTADAGARNDAANQPSQWSESDLVGKSPEAIDEARQKGQLNDLLGIKT